MSTMNTAAAYGSISRLNHWITAALFIGLIALGLYMEDLPKGPLKSDLVQIHKGLAIALMAFVVLRIAWRFINPGPAMVRTGTPLEQKLAVAVHALLVLGLVAMPLSGWIMSNAGGHPAGFFGLFTLPALVDKSEVIKEIAGTVHELLGKAMIAVIALHLAGALKHHFVYRDDTLRRMIVGTARDDA
jgi:cytochrome b561